MLPSPFDHVTAAALGAGPEDRLSRRCVSLCGRVDRGAAKTTDVRGHLPDVVVAELAAVRRHLRAGDPVLDRVEDFLIRAAKIAAILRGNRRSELTARPVLPMARRARLVVQLLAFRDGGRIPNRRIHGRRRTAAALGGEGDTCEEQRAESQRAENTICSSALCSVCTPLTLFLMAVLIAPPAARRRSHSRTPRSPRIDDHRPSRSWARR